MNAEDLKQEAEKALKAAHLAFQDGDIAHEQSLRLLAKKLQRQARELESGFDYKSAVWRNS